MTAPTRCPCGSGDTYDDCCGRFHRGASAPATAKALMQSRFSAFAVANAAYLLASWHSTTRPTQVDLDGDTRWTRLEILQTSDGGLFDATGIVEFRAHYRSGTVRAVLHERSTFAREAGQWRYLSGVTPG